MKSSCLGSVLGFRFLTDVSDESEMGLRNAEWTVLTKNSGEINTVKIINPYSAKTSMFSSKFSVKERYKDWLARNWLTRTINKT